MNVFAVILFIEIQFGCVNAWPIGQANGQPGMEGTTPNPMWGGGMFGNPYMMPGGGTPPTEFGGSTTKKPTRREYMLKQASKRKVDGPKAKFDPNRPYNFDAPNSLQNGPQKDELEMFVDSVKRMATGFHRLEFRLTKAIKMIDKFVTAV